MNSRRICVETRGTAEKSACHRNRVEFPDFPGNREADDGARNRSFSHCGLSREKALQVG